MTELKVQSDIMGNTASLLSREAHKLSNLANDVFDVCRELLDERQLRTVEQKVRKSARNLNELSDIAEKMVRVMDEAEKMYFRFESRISEETLKI